MAKLSRLTSLAVATIFMFVVHVAHAQLTLTPVDPPAPLPSVDAEPPQPEESAEFESAPAAETDQPAPNPVLSSQFSAASAAAATSTRSGAASARLAQAPEMFGDSMMLGGVTVVTTTDINSEAGTITTPARFPVGSFGLKVSDNNSPLPRDRVYYRFSHYQDLIQASPAIFGGGVDDSFVTKRSLPVHTVGFEKTFFDGMTSVEVRMPFAERVLIDEAFLSGGVDPTEATVGIATAGEGNMSIITKAIFGYGDEMIWGGGVAVETPTGRDTNFLFDFTRGQYRNQATYICPYLAALWTPSSDFFHQTFFGVNVPVSDDELAIADNITVDPDDFFTDSVTPATLLSLDLSSGYWLYRGKGDRWITDLAFIGEFHYTGSLGTPNPATIDVAPAVINAGVASVDYMNLTGGVHMQLGPSMAVRTSGVVPLADRPFKNEFTVQWTYWF